MTASHETASYETASYETLIRDAAGRLCAPFDDDYWLARASRCYAMLKS